MTVTCPTCKLEYDDARCLTFCPHLPLASDEILDRKDLAFKVFDSRKLYKVKNTGIVGRVSSIDYRGMVSLDPGSLYDVYDPNDLEEVV